MTGSPFPFFQGPYDRPASHSGRAGFSLIELLAVIAIIAVVATMAVSGFQRAAEGNEIERALNGVTAGLELARQTAISQSTYTWVFLAEDDLGPADGNTITMAVVASRDGSLPTTSSGDKFRLVSRVEEFRGVKFGSDADAPSVKLPVRSGAFIEEAKVSGPRRPPPDVLPEWARRRDFTSGRVVMFSPTGEAALDRNESSSAEIPIYEGLQITLVPSKGSSPSELERKSTALVFVNGITGAPSVHQSM
jgi:prepilin-type N-terminal cleavage/methylation domain